MKIVPVEAVPRRNPKHDLQNFIKDFIESDYQIVKIDFNEHDYKSPTSCRSCVGIAAKRSGYPIGVAIRGDDVYLWKL